MVQKSAKEEEIKDKGSKCRIYIPVYTCTCHQVRLWFIIFLLAPSNVLAYVYLGHWNQHAILSSHCTFRCWKVADIASYSLVLVRYPFPRFFYHHPSPLRVALQRKLGKLPKRQCLKSTVMLPYKVLNLLQNRFSSCSGPYRSATGSKMVRFKLSDSHISSIPVLSG